MSKSNVNKCFYHKGTSLLKPFRKLVCTKSIAYALELSDGNFVHCNGRVMFLATLASVHFTYVGNWVGGWAEF